MTADPRDLDADVVEMLRAMRPSAYAPTFQAFLDGALAWQRGQYITTNPDDFRAIARWAAGGRMRAWCAGRDAAAAVCETRAHENRKAGDTAYKAGAEQVGRSYSYRTLEDMQCAFAIRALSPPAATEAK